MTLRGALWLLALTLAACGEPAARRPDAALPKGGDLELTTAEGRQFRLADHPEEVKLLYFGFTRCPSACPTALGRAEAIAHLLAPDSLDKRLLFLFVTIDPERDTPARLEEYLSFFGVRGVGLTGSEFAIRKTADRYGATFEKTMAGPQNGYFFNHTTSFFLIDQGGALRRVVAPDAPVEDVAGWVRELLRDADL